MSDGVATRLAARGPRWHRLANPAVFQRLSRAVLPWSTAIALLCMGTGLGLGLFGSPPDYQQGDSVRIMYIHVPAAWLASMVYGSMAVASFVGIVWKHPLADLYTRAVAPVGAVFTLVCLVTGSLWGRPTWGAWWVWDARLTSVLVLFFLYLGYLALVDAFDDPARGLRAGAILVLVGSVNLPIIKFSVEWWNTLHQPASILRMGGPTIDPAMLHPLLAMLVGTTALFVSLALVRTESEIMARRIRQLQLLAADRDAGGRDRPFEQA